MGDGFIARDERAKLVSLAIRELNGLHEDRPWITITVCWVVLCSASM